MLFNFLPLHSLIFLSLALLAFVGLMVLHSLRWNGMLIFFLALIVSVAALALKNLYLQFFGNSLLFLFIYIIIDNLAIILYYRKKPLEFSQLIHEIVHPFEEHTFKIETNNLPAVFPGFYYLISFQLNAKSSETQSYLIPLNDIGKRHFVFQFTIDRHGEYIFQNFKFVFKDIFGFTALHLPVTFQQRVQVFPYFIDPIKIPFFLNKGQDEVIQTTVRENSTDFFENRKYYPGDDTRRINWNIFAHIGELHIREVEKIPPKTGSITLLFAPYSPYPEEYEFTSSLFLATVKNLLKYELEIIIYSPASDKPVLINKTSEKDFNRLINSAYHPLDDKNRFTTGEPVVFCSFEEYKTLIDHELIRNTFCAVVFYHYSPVKQSVINRLIKIGQNDNLIREMLMMYRSGKMAKERSIQLTNYQELGLQKKIQTEIFRIDHEFKQQANTD